MKKIKSQTIDFIEHLSRLGVEHFVEREGYREVRFFKKHTEQQEQSEEKKEVTKRFFQKTLFDDNQKHPAFSYADSIMGQPPESIGDLKHEEAE